jgi:hypothetical protein
MHSHWEKIAPFEAKVFASRESAADTIVIVQFLPGTQHVCDSTWHWAWHWLRKFYKARVNKSATRNHPQAGS